MFVFGIRVDGIGGINAGIISTEVAPFGGMKESGIGHRHGAGGIRKYCHQQTILVARFGLSKEPIWYPVPKGAVNLYKRILNLLFRSGWRNKLSA